MSEKTVERPPALAPALKFALELGPLALFFLSYWKFGIFVATWVMMASVLVTLVVSYWKLKRLPTMPLVTAVIVLVFGGLTQYLHDPTFVKIKPTVLYVLFSGALFFGLFTNRPMLKIMFDGALHLTDEGWRKLTWRWAYFFLAHGDCQRDRVAHHVGADLGDVQVVRLFAADGGVRPAAGPADHALRGEGGGGGGGSVAGRAEAGSSSAGCESC